MADMMPQIGDVPLCRVALPGTHDSGTYGMTTQSALDPYNEGARARVVEAVDHLVQQRGISGRQLLLGWSQAQDLSISDQLHAGIRYLDLRVSLVDATYVLGHVLVSGTLDDALQQVLMFTQRYPSELIILDVNHVYGMETIESQVALINFIAGILDGRLVLGLPTLGPSSTVNEILQHDPVNTARVILLFASSAAIAASGRSEVWCSEAENFPTCESSQIISLWPDHDNATGVLDHIKSQPQRDLNRFYVSQGQITPSEQLISLSPHPSSLREAAKLCNPEVISMAAREWRGTGANIIILDFFEIPSG
ncbi:MAG: phosphatidylinositol-specific phospholipase C domain-containing protein, partial [Mycobacterium sp.]